MRHPAAVVAPPSCCRKIPMIRSSLKGYPSASVSSLADATQMEKFAGSRVIVDGVQHDGCWGIGEHGIFSRQTLVGVIVRVCFTEGIPTVPVWT